jgi:hydroxymethylpyrimidine pyrophosphatase-like HAD family hydrolase
LAVETADGLRYRLVVSDIDCTLLDSTSTLRPAVLAAIEEAREAGIVFTVATGRRYSTTLPLLQAMGLVPLESRRDRPMALHGGREVSPAVAQYVVLQTGAMVVSADGGDVLWRHPVPREGALRAIEILVKLGLQPIVYEDRVLEQRLFAGPEEHDSPGARTYLTANPHTVERRPFDTLVGDKAPLQLAVIDGRAPLEAAVPLLKLAHCRTIISYSMNLDSYFMEVFHQDCNKWQGAERVARHFGIDPKETVCVGDNWNDVEMLANAGCGVAVANAAEGIRKYARRIARSNDEDAVAQILLQIMAGEEPGAPNEDYDPALGH